MPAKPVLLAAALLLVVSCAGPPPPECSRQVEESSVDFDCGPTPDAEWSQEAVDEAEERFEESAPGGRR